MYNINNIDLPGVYMAAMQAHSMRAAAEDRRAQLQLEKDKAFAEQHQKAQEKALLVKARQSMAKGDTTLMEIYFPEEYGKSLANQEAQQKFNQAQIDQTNETERNTANIQKFVSEQLAKDPSSAPDLQVYIDNLARNNQIRAFQIPGHTLPPDLAGPQMEPTQEEIQKLGRGAAMSLAMTPQKQKDITTLQQNLIAAGLEPGTPMFQRKLMELIENDSKKGTINLNTGTATATAGTRAEQEEALLEAQDQIEMLGELDRLAGADPERGIPPNFSKFLGVFPQGKKTLLAGLESINPNLVPEDHKAWLQDMSRFRSIVDEYRSGRFNKLLGSAQSAAEVRNLANAVLSADMGTTQFMETKARFEQVLKRKVAVAEQVLSEGIPLGSLGYRKRFGELEGPGVTKAAPRPQQPASSAPGNKPPPAKSKEQLLKDLEAKKGSLKPGVYERAKAGIMAMEE
jgi:hypothetical protein